MVMVLLSFRNNGAPATGLDPLPTIRIRDLSDNSLVVTDLNMVEVGEGFYKYNFITYDKEKDYGVRGDAGVIITNNLERYVYAGNPSFLDDISTKITEQHGSGAYLSADLSGVALEATAVVLHGELSTMLARALGLIHENHYTDQYVFGENGQTSSRFRIYSNAGSVGSDNDVLATYVMEAVYSNGLLSSYKVVKQ